MTKLAGELSSGYIKSRTLRRLFDEMKDLDLECPAEAYTSRYRQDKRGPYVTVLSINEVAKVVKTLVPEYGNPTSYEVLDFFGVEANFLSYDKPRNYGKWKEWDILKNGKKTKSSARIVYWGVKTIGQALRLSNSLAKLGVTYYTSAGSIKIYAPLDCFVSNLLKSDLPSEWDRLNKLHWEALQRSKKIKDVGNKLDRKV